jgi:hypothetical protein
VRRPRAGLITATVALALTLAGCGSGIDNETQLEHASVQAAHANVGPIQIGDVYITPVGDDIQPSPDVSLADPDVTSVSPDVNVTLSMPPKGSVDGYLVATIIDTADTGSDQLAGATIAGGQIKPVPAGANFTVHANGLALFDDPAQNPAGQYLTIVDRTAPLVVGTTVAVTFSMAAAGTTETIQVPVVSSNYGAPPASVPAGLLPSRQRSVSPAPSTSALPPTTTASP